MVNAHSSYLLFNMHVYIHIYGILQSERSETVLGREMNLSANVKCFFSFKLYLINGDYSKLNQ